MDWEKGLICALTSAKPIFDYECESRCIDEEELTRRKHAAQEQLKQDFYPIAASKQVPKESSLHKNNPLEKNDFFTQATDTTGKTSNNRKILLGTAFIVAAIVLWLAMYFLRDRISFWPLLLLVPGIKAFISLQKK